MSRPNVVKTLLRGLVILAVLAGCSERDPGYDLDRAPSSAAESRSLAAIFAGVGGYPGRPWYRDGREVSRQVMSLAQGPEHCDWQGALFLGGDGLLSPRDLRGGLWTRDPNGVLKHFPQARLGFRARTTLPADASPTGFTQGAVEVWTAPSDAADFVYLVHADKRSDVERWVRGGGGCA